jgi:L-alanine-DL-glutamate epimerase-like enolase superfamily enzyme
LTRRLLTVRRESWPLARPFAISRGVKTAAEVVVCTIVEGAATGRAECVPYGRYGETPDSVEGAIFAMRDALEQGATRADVAAMLMPGAARNAIDCALWDLEAKLSGIPAWRSAELAAPAGAVTAYTISLDTPQAMAEAAAEAAERPLLKLKLGADAPLACVAAVRKAAPASRLIADANEGWSFAQLTSIAHELAALGVDLIEQPLPAIDDARLEDWESPVLLCADESFHVAADIASLGKRYGAVNIKLDKTGGLTEALASLHAAKNAGMKVMVGCMVSTSLAMAPAALLAGAADFVDLDGPLLLKEDRPGGMTFDGSLMHPPSPYLWG